jgi:uncharacterized membrane protein
MNDIELVLGVTTALGCALNAGVFFAFSSFVMPALSRLPPGDGVRAMQAINVAAVRPMFMTSLFGTAVLCLVVIVLGIAGWEDDSGPYLVGGGVAFVVGTIGLTVAYHVPRNDRLADLDPEDPQSAGSWRRYVAEWTRWNHVRAAAGLLAAALLSVGIALG